MIRPGDRVAAKDADDTGTVRLVYEDGGVRDDRGFRAYRGAPRNPRGTVSVQWDKLGCCLTERISDLEVL